MRRGKTRNPSWTQGNSLLAEVGSVQLELKYLSHHLKDETYANKVRCDDAGVDLMTSAGTEGDERPLQ